MTYSFKALICASTLVAAAGIAASETADQVDFTFNPNDPVEKIYSDMDATATEACKAEYKDSAITSVWPTAIRACKADLLSQAIDSTKMAELQSYYANREVPEAQIIVATISSD